MSATIPPLGTPEGLETEYKRGEKLRNTDRRRDIVRTVVAMRNAKGGSIWVGVTEEEGALTGVEPLKQEDRPHVDSLGNQLIDLVEPLLEIGRDVRLETVDVPGGWVLEVRVQPRQREAPPACVLWRGGREFLKRSGSRNALLSYSEVVRAEQTGAPSIREATEKLHDEWSSQFAHEAGLAFTAAPDPHRHPDSLPAKISKEALELLKSPPDEIRRDGWSWFSKSSPPRLVRGHVRAGANDDEPYRVLELQPSGTLQFFTTTEHLSWNEKAPPKLGFELPPKGQIYPYALAEVVASLIRTYSVLLKTREFESLETVGLLLSFERATGWIMCRTGPDSWHFATTRRSWFQVLDDSTRSSLLLQPADAIRKTPDLISYRLLVDLLETDLGEQTALPWFEGGPDAPHFSPPR